MPRNMPQGKRRVPSDHENAEDSRFLKRRREEQDLKDAQEERTEIGRWTDGYF